MTGVYLHIPFCLKKCFYCSFCVAVNQKFLMDDYVDALSREMALRAGTGVASVYFGGGTPSLLEDRHVLFLMEAVRKNFSVAEGAEVTVELNPEDVVASRLRCYHEAGVTRLSLGAQTFQDRALAFLGRVHSSEQIYDAWRLIRQEGFTNVNIDLMYGFPSQPLDDIVSDLRAVERLGPEHVSIYSLTVEEGSRFFADSVSVPDSGVMADYYLRVREKLLSSGYDHYEVSNFSRPGMRSVHNMNYWQGGDYFGFGMSAHSHQEGRRWWNVPRARAYIEKVRAMDGALEGEECLIPEGRLGEALVFGLRMLEGVDVERIEKMTGAVLSDRQRDTIARFVRDGYFKRDAGCLAVTEKGLLVLDSLSPYLLQK